MQSRGIVSRRLPDGGLADGGLVLAELKAKIKIKNLLESGRDRPKTYDFLRKMAVRTLPRDPPGGWGAKNKFKNHFKHSQVMI